MKSAIVIKPIATLYEKDSKESAVADEVLFGMSVDIISSQGDNWYYVKTQYNYKGFINVEDVSIVDSELLKFCKYDICQVKVSFADILVEDNIKSKTIITIPRGSYIYITGKMSKNGLWNEVILKPGSFGWIKRSFLRYVDFTIRKGEDELRENIVQSAMSYLGTQYRWGGKTPMGIDCSGLCSMAYMLNDINIYRDAKIDSNFPIRETEIIKIKKGDLIYFPGHMAMYIGGGRYIHASDDNNVVMINSFNKESSIYKENLANSILCAGSYFY